MTEYLPDPSSPYELLLEASRSEDPSFSLKQLKDSIIRRQQYGEVTIDQIQEHLEMEQWVEMKKRKAEGELRWYKSDKRYSVGILLTYSTKIQTLAVFSWNRSILRAFHSSSGYHTQQVSIESCTIKVELHFCSWQLFCAGTLWTTAQKSRFEGENNLSICNLLGSICRNKLSTIKMKLCLFSVRFIHNPFKVGHF